MAEQEEFLWYVGLIGHAHGEHLLLLSYRQRFTVYSRSTAVAKTITLLTELFNDSSLFKEDLQVFNMGSLSILGLKDGIELELHAGLVTEELLELLTAL